MPLVIKGIIFDMDGTLGDTIPVCFAAYRAAVEEPLGKRLSDADIVALFGPNEEGILQRAVPDIWKERFEVYLQEYERAHSLCNEPFPGVKAALDLLKAKGIKLAVVTGKGEHSCRISLEHLGLDEMFDMVVTGSPEGGRKPVSIRKVLAEWKLEPEQAAYVGDAPSDIDDAREVGVVSIGAAWAPSADAGQIAAKDPDVLFTSVHAFTEWIKANIIFA